jgi:hypothetical protein
MKMKNGASNHSSIFNNNVQLNRFINLKTQFKQNIPTEGLNNDQLSKNSFWSFSDNDIEYILGGKIQDGLEQAKIDSIVSQQVRMTVNANNEEEYKKFMGEIEKKKDDDKKKIIEALEKVNGSPALAKKIEELDAKNNELEKTPKKEDREKKVREWLVHNVSKDLTSTFNGEALTSNDGNSKPVTQASTSNNGEVSSSVLKPLISVNNPIPSENKDQLNNKRDANKLPTANKELEQKNTELKTANKELAQENTKRLQSRDILSQVMEEVRNNKWKSAVKTGLLVGGTVLCASLALVFAGTSIMAAFPALTGLVTTVASFSTTGRILATGGVAAMAAISGAELGYVVSDIREKSWAKEEFDRRMKEAESHKEKQV